MAAALPNGSPSARARATNPSRADGSGSSRNTMDIVNEIGRAYRESRAAAVNDTAPDPLMSSKLANQSNRIAAYKQKMEHAGNNAENGGPLAEPMNRLLAQLAQQEMMLLNQRDSLAATEAARVKTDGLAHPGKHLTSSSDGSLSRTPASDSFGDDVDDTDKEDVRHLSNEEVHEMLRLKRELAEANDKIAHMDRELLQTRITKDSIDQVLASPCERDFPEPAQVSDRTIGNLQGRLNAAIRGPRPPPTRATQTWGGAGGAGGAGDAASDTAVVSAPYARHFAIWSNPSAGGTPQAATTPAVGGGTGAGGILPARDAANGWGEGPARAPLGQGDAPNLPVRPAFSTVPSMPRHPTPGLFNAPGFVGDGRGPTNQVNQMNPMGGLGPYPTGPMSRRPQPPMARGGNPFNHGHPGNMGNHGSIGNMGNMGNMGNIGQTGHMSNHGGVGGMSNIGWGYRNDVVYQDGIVSPSPTPMWQQQSLMPPAPSYHRGSSVGSALSPMAPEFTTLQPQYNNSWNSCAKPSPTQTYVSPCEPLNYRRLLERTVNCDWRYIVDKIVCSNDQQASIFLQQKLKMGTAEQKFDIVEAIVSQAYPLMVNRFGNFLIQRCFEHGTSEQVVSIANAIRGNTLKLSMDSFGCHVVQKAFDCVPEDYKAVMVHELLRRIPETVVHRYACHVWQKLFELRWSGPPPQIMKYVNEALRGMWHDVALGETGSLVVQNVFENCLEEDKRPCINEVLASIDIVSRGQFGNWCIQHICEHGMPADRSRAIDHILRHAAEYSMDQFASKVVEKCLKIGGVEFLECYLGRVCEGRPDRPRIPLIEIASDQYGNYLIQWILINSNPQHREIVASHVRKHMVSLRGSKFGAKVGMLCCNPAYATRPGPGVGPFMSRFGPGRLGPAYR